jgi:2,3-dihydroxy-2,3-dihydro-p-cumate dehydrogenase
MAETQRNEAAAADGRRLAGRVALVTGAAGGIGAAIAHRLAADGAKLVLADVPGSPVADVAAAIADAGHGRPVVETGDLAQEDAAGRIVAAAVAAHGGLDILVNNAGGGIIKPFLSHTPETLRTTIDRNLWTTLWCTWHAIPQMKAKGYGRIVNIGADSVRNGLWDHAAYNAAKGGVHAMASGLAREFAADGITVNVVAPCIVETPQVTAARQTVPEWVAKFVSVVPLGRPGSMAEVASMVAYLASEEASFVTGQVISVNGGSTMQ